MLIARWASAAIRSLLRFRYVATALVLYGAALLIRNSSPWALLYFALVLLLLAGVAFFSVRNLSKGKIVRRRRIEGAINTILALDLATLSTGHPVLYLLSFPLFLSFVYSGYRNRNLLLFFLAESALLVGHVRGHSKIYLHLASGLILLFLWTFFAALFRSRETEKRREIVDRLRLYEREASELTNRSAEVGEALRMDEKKRAHLASMIREREKSFRNLLHILQKTFEPHTAAFFLFDPNQDAFLLKEFISESDRFAERRVQPIDGLFRLVAKEQSPVRLVSASGELRGLTYYDGPPAVRSVIAVPVRSNDLLNGVLILDRLKPAPFSDEESETIQQIAGQLARTMDNAEALQTYFELQEELAAFYAASNVLNRSLKVEDVVRTLLDSTEKIIRYDWGLVILHDAESDSNIVAAEQGPDRGSWVGKEFACASERGLISWVIQNQAPLSYTNFCSRSGKTVLFNKNFRVPNVYDSILIVPMQLKGEPLGALFLAARKNHFFSRSVRKMLEVVTVIASASLKNARMVGALERLATTDGLTGLANHRTFQETLSSEIDRVVRHPAPLSLLLIDIDYFKKFNDEYGHPVGDFVLRSIGGVLHRAVRKVDTVSRYGGEEFAVILVNTTAAGALQLAERMVSDVARRKLDHQGLSLHVTISVGVATLPEDGVTREELIDCADRALYASKHRGRNRATAFSRSLKKVSPEKKELELIIAAEDELRYSLENS